MLPRGAMSSPREESIAMPDAGNRYRTMQGVVYETIKERVLTMVRAEGKKMTDRAFALLKERLRDEAFLEPELAKLMSYVGEKQLIEAKDVTLTWYVGLDAEGTKIGDALWTGAEVDQTAQARIVGLFRLRFRDASSTIDKLAGEPVYLILAMTPEQVLRVKPQNLVTGLLVRRLEMVS